MSETSANSQDGSTVTKPVATPCAAAASVVVVDADQNTLLHYYAAAGRDDEVRRHLDHVSGGRDIDAPNYLGWTPLMLAARNGHMATIRLLLERDADASRHNRFGLNAFHMALTRDDLRLVRLLLEYLLSGGISRRFLQRTVSPLALALLYDQRDTFAYLLDQCFDVDVATPVTGITPLMFAMVLDCTEAVTALLARRTDASARNVGGATAHDLQVSKRLRVAPPMIVVDAAPSAPVPPPLQLTPMLTRHSSDTVTPSAYLVPNVSPFTPLGIYAQPVFFPADFSPAQFVSPTPYMGNDILNMAFYQPGNYYSPIDS